MPALSRYTMPAVGLGDTVLWRHGQGATDPAPAIVTRVGQYAVSLIIFAPESKVGIVRDGVRHESDPELARIQNDAGVWSYSAMARRVQDLVEALDLDPGAR